MPTLAQVRRRRAQRSVSSASNTTTIRLPRLHTAQRQIKSERLRYNVITCGRRFGKDILSIDLLLERALDGYPVAWFQPSYKSLLEVWRTVKRILRPITAPNGVSEQDKRIELITGGVLDFWSLDGDPEACRGRKYARVIVNEAAKARHLRLAWEQAIRPTLTDYRGDAYFPSTPRGRDFYAEMWERGRDDNAEWPRWKSWQMPTSRNPHIHPDELAEARAELPTTTYLQEYEAQFLDVAGRFFDEWEPTRHYTDVDARGDLCDVRRDWHVCDPFALPGHWPCWGAVDYGTTSSQPTWCFLLLTIDEHGTVYVVDECYEAGLQSPAQAQRVLDCLHRHRLAKPVDPERLDGLWEVDARFGMIPFDWANTFPPQDVSERKGKYPVETYWERGLACCVRAVKDRVAGWREVKRLLHGCRVGRDEDGEETAYPLFRVFRGRCSNLIRTLPLLVRSEKDPEDIEGGNHRGGEDKQEDHLADCLRYGLMTRPRPSGPDPALPPAPKPYQPRWMRKTDKKVPL